jgi:hypothetical protein
MVRQQGARGLMDSLTLLPNFIHQWLTGRKQTEGRFVSEQEFCHIFYFPFE